MCVYSATCWYPPFAPADEPNAENADRASDHLDVLPPAFLDLHLFCPQYSCRPRDPTYTDGERERDDKRSSSELDSRYTLLTWWTRCHAHEGALTFPTLVDL